MRLVRRAKQQYGRGKPRVPQANAFFGKRNAEELRATVQSGFGDLFHTVAVSIRLHDGEVLRFRFEARAHEPDIMLNVLQRNFRVS